MEKPRTLLLTIHGSHLYGLSHVNSDVDMFRVVDEQPVVNRFGAAKKKSGVHSVVDKDDTTVFNFKTFAIHAHNGVPQALEAMFSPLATVDILPAYRAGFRASRTAMATSYIHAIEKFAKFDFKRRRHALRYALNLKEALENGGRFNPVLSSADKDMITEMAMSTDYISHLRKISYFELNLHEQEIKQKLDEELHS